MAITTVNASFFNGGTAAALATGGAPAVLAFGGSDMLEVAYKGIATFTGDAASSSATLNYVDGTSALPFTPSAIMATRCGGAATATIGVVSVVDAANANKTATVQFTGTVNAATISVCFMIFR